MNGESKEFLKVWSTIFASAFYTYFIVSHIPKGKYRFISLVPIFVIFTILPLSISTVLPCGITAFFITWLANFKLLLFAFDLGPLASFSNTRKGLDMRNLTLFLRFILIALFPIKIKDSSSFTKSQKPKKVVPLNLWSQTLISSILLAICDRYKGQLHPRVVFVIYCCLLYLLVDIIIGVSNLLVKPIMGVELVPPSDEPYLASSLQDFWGRRWNLMVTDTLRHTVYKPTREFLSKYIGKIWAAGLAVLAAFLVSGLMHELIYYYMTRVSPSWEVTWFFVLHGLCVVSETSLKKVLGARMRLHWAVTGPLAVGFVMGTGYLWFFPPLVRNKVDLRTIEELKVSYEFIKRSSKFSI